MREVVFDIETDGLNASKIHVIVCIDIDTDEVFVFDTDMHAFMEFAKTVSVWIGHNSIYFDHKVLSKFFGLKFDKRKCIDTLVLSQLLDTGREGGHSLEAWGVRLGHPKIEHEDWTTYTPEMRERCIGDCRLTLKVYNHLMKIVNRTKGAFDKAFKNELMARWTAREMNENGFPFDIVSARNLYKELEQRQSELEPVLAASFEPKVEYKQLKTKLKETIIPFNPGSPKQIVDRLWEAGWEPINKTKTHEKEERSRKVSERTKRYGWKIDETNLSTLPEGYPKGFDVLLEHMIVSSRLRTLTEWMNAYDETTGCIHGDFNPLGTRTHRCVHSKPNMGNVATKKTIKYNSQELRKLATDLGGRMRSMWGLTGPELSDTNVWLVGTDMESAHLRIFGHLINDKEFIHALISGRKEDGTDPHTVNKNKLGDICVDRDRSKTFIFTYLNGGQANRVRHIFGCSLSAAKQGLQQFVESYPGLKRLRETRIPKDAARGYFEGVDGRFVVNDSEHLMMGMYLQNMESVIMKYACEMWKGILDRLGIHYKLINWVHDEFVTTVYGDKKTAEFVGRVQAWSISKVGKMFKLNCPMGGEYKIGKNWLEVH